MKEKGKSLKLDYVLLDFANTRGNECLLFL